jgi:hypothetical protein
MLLKCRKFIKNGLKRKDSFYFWHVINIDVIFARNNSALKLLWWFLVK